MTKETFKNFFMSLYNGLDNTGKLIVTVVILFMGYNIYDNSLLHTELEREREVVDSVSKRVEQVTDKVIPSHNNHLTIDESTDQGKILQTALDGLMRDVGADRVFMFEFHNTIAMSRGVDEKPVNFSYMSCTFENVRTEIPTRGFELKNMLVTRWNNWVWEIKEGGFVYINTDDIENIIYRSYYQQHNVQSTIVVPIQNRSGETIAILGVEWINQSYNDLSESRKEFMLIDTFRNAALHMSEQSANFAPLLIRMP